MTGQHDVNLACMRIVHVVGARPNFMKLSPVYRALADLPGIQQLVVHTGQHYDFNMSDTFFEQLGIGSPDVNLKVGSASHSKQTADIMVAFEAVVLDHQPDLVVVYGDVNSTVAAALVCSKLGVPVAHVEAGLRSYDRSMPEEINRLLTDQISDLLFTPSIDGNENLLREGVSKEKIFLVGNVMIDTLISMLTESRKIGTSQSLPPRFALLTLHRPSNVDDPEWLDQMLTSLDNITENFVVLFPVHPRTREKMKGLRQKSFFSIKLMDPQPYLTFLALEELATVVITDSGGIQEETTYLGVPCLTVRENTERPITVDIGTNILVGRDPKRVRQETKNILDGARKVGKIPPLWDGRAGVRIACAISEFMDKYVKTRAKSRYGEVHR